MSKLKYIALFILLGSTGFAFGYFASQTMTDTNVKNQRAQVIQEEVKIPEPPKITKISFVGDMMFDRSVRTSVNKNFKGDYNELFIHLKELANSDILFGNLEGPVSDVGNNVGSKYSFRMDPLVPSTLVNAGFDIVSFANNHVGDWNVKAFEDTLKRLGEVNLKQTGAGMNKTEAEQVTIIERNGVKFGFIGFSDVGPAWMEAKENKSGILLANNPRFKEIISNAKQNVDVLIVSFHWGDEYKKIHNKRQETLAHSAVDSGADMVIGHHPHVMQDIEVYNGAPIVYSLGNFIFDQYFSVDTMQGMLFEATFEDKTLKDTKSRIITLNKKYQPDGIYESVEEAALANACPKPTKIYEDYSYLGVDQGVAIPDTTYTPSDLRPVKKDISTGSFCLKKEAVTAIEEMFADAKMDGYMLKVSSGFRDYGTQVTILNNNLKNTNQNVSTSVAKAGYSEHQLGTAIDITSPSVNNAGASKIFEGTKEAAWLETNAHKYGFIQSYPKGKEDITGYIYEPWHYRYVGKDHAEAITKSGETINQYLKNL